MVDLDDLEAKMAAAAAGEIPGGQWLGIAAQAAPALIAELRAARADLATLEAIRREAADYANRLDAWRFHKGEYLADIARLTKERDEARAEVSEILAASDATQSMPTQACRDRDRALAELREEKKRSTRLRQAIDDIALKHVHGVDGAQCPQCELFKVFCCCGAETSRDPHDECDCAGCEACDWTGSYLFVDDHEPTEGE